MGLANRDHVICCEFNEALHLNDPDWDTTVVGGKLHYRVKYHDEWLVVEDRAVVDVPNKYGAALAWIVHINGKPWIKCFLKGTEI